MLNRTIHRRARKGVPIELRLFGIPRALCLLGVLSGVTTAAGPTQASEVPIGGTVVDRDGEPIPQAEVLLLAYPRRYDVALARLEDRQLPAVARGESDATGRFALTAPAAGMWFLSVEAPGHARAGLLLTPLLSRRELRPIALEPAAAVTVTVTDPDGEPVAGSLVLLESRLEAGDFDPERERVRQRPRAIRTDVAGRARFEVAQRARFGVSVSAPGYAPWQRGGLAGAEVEVRLERGAERTLEIVDPAGSPLAAAVILLGSGSLPLSLADEKGLATLRVSEDEGAEQRSLLVRALGPNGGFGVGEVDLAREEVLELELRTRTVAGRVLVAEGREPVPDALVWSWADPAAYARTGADGRYALTLPPAGGQLYVSAAAPGYFPESVPSGSEADSRGEGPTLVLRPAATLSGTVVDEEGRALEGIQVRPRPSGRARFFSGRPQLVTRSAPDGSFLLGPLEPGQALQLEGRGAGWAPTRLEVPPIAADAPARVTLEMKRGRRAFGTIVDEEDSPIAGAEVTLRQATGSGAAIEQLVARRFDEEQPAVLTDREGRFEMEDLAPGRYDLRAEAAGFAPATVPAVEIPDAERATEIGTLALAPGVIVDGIVTGLSGSPIAGAEVRLLDERVIRVLTHLDQEREPEGVSDADGRFTVVDLAAGQPIALRVTSKGYLPVTLGGVRPPTDEPLEVRLEPAATLRGSVVDERREGIPGASVILRRQQNAGRSGPISPDSLMMSGSSDREGRFEIEGLTPDRWDLSVSSRGYQPSRSEGIEITAGREPEELVIVLRKGATVLGRVFGADGEPLVGVTLRPVVEELDLLRLPGSMAADRSDGDGRYRLEGLALGTASIAAEHPGHRRVVQDLEVRRGENLLDFRLERGWEIRGRVVDDSLVPVSGASVAARRSGANVIAFLRQQNQVESAPDGSFVVPGLSDGSYVVSAEKAGYASAETEEAVLVDGGSVDGIELRFEPGAAIVGEILGLDLDELSRVQVLAMQPGGMPRPLLGQVSHDGRYRIDNLRSGDWMVAATLGQGGGRTINEMATLDPGVVELELDLEFGGGLVLRGQVLRGDQPATGYILVATGKNGISSARGETDHEGRFALEHLEPDTYVVAVLDLGGPLHSEEIELEADREVRIELRDRAVSGTILDDEEGSPIEGAEITLRPLEEERRDFTFFLGTPSRSDPSGRFRLAPVGAGRYRLHARREGYSVATLDFELGDGDVEGLEVSMSRTDGLTLFVLRSSGAPAEEADVVALDAAGQPILIGTFGAGAEGRIHLEDLPVGSWTLLVAASGSATTAVRVRVPGEPLRVQLPEAGGLRVTVPALVGSGLRSRLTLRDPQGARYRAIAFQQVLEEWRLVDGKLTLLALPPGTWTLEVETVDGERSWRFTTRVLPAMVLDVLVE